MDLGAFLRYWALTFAVFVFFVFAMIIVALDVLESLRETARKRRAARQPLALDPNPLAARTVAGTVFPGPGQQLDSKREWVARLAEDTVRRVDPRPPVRALVLEDSKGHPFVHFSNGKRLQTYRFDRAQIEAAMAGDASKVTEVAGRLTRHLTADFLGREDVRPPRTTELAREAGAKPVPAAKATAVPTASVAPAPAPVPASPPADAESMSREERLAAARAKAEALRAARQKPPAS